MEEGFSSYSSLYDTSSLLQFCNDDSASAASSMEVTDRVASLEQRVQMQEDEIQLLKSALADVVRRLNLSEEQQSLGPRRGPTKARPMIATLPLRPTVNNGTVLPKKGSGTLPSPSGMGSRKDAPLSANRSTVRRANSNEHMGTLTRRDSGETKGNRTRAGSTGSNSSGKRSDSSRQREPIFNAGTRRVTHCKVTVQLYLSSTAKRTGSDCRSAGLKALAPPPAVSPPGPSLQAGGPSRTAGVRKTPSISLQLRKSRSLSQSAFRPLDTPSYRGPVRSPSHYFQICY